MAVWCMRSASGHIYRNSSFIVDVAMGQIPRSTERISSVCTKLHQFLVIRPISVSFYEDKQTHIINYALNHYQVPSCNS